MKNRILKMMMVLMIVIISACSLDPVLDPNFASVNAVESNATKSQLNAMAVGQISLARNGLQTYTLVVGTIGKELFNFNSTESRWMTELNGLKIIDNSAFYNTATTGFGLPIRQANIILGSLEKTSLVTDQEKNAYRGLANTFKGLAYLYMLNAQYQNGVRLNVEDPFHPSKPATYTESLAGIANFLDQGATQLDGAGATFPFTMPTGFAGFDTPSTFKKFNRAIALRVAIYQKDWTKAATLLPQTFFNEAGSLTTGPKHTFNPSAPDFGNPLINTGSSIIVAVEKLMTDAEPGDTRVTSKVIDVTKLTPALSPLAYASGVTYESKFRTNIYTSATTPFTIIRNEELILIAAEIAAQQNNPTNAQKYINIVRTAAGLPNYSGAITQSALIDAILKERLYSLFYEGHRWVDMRRYDKISEIYLPVATMKVLTQLERPVQEVNWDSVN
jgi:hypothetical protein